MQRESWRTNGRLRKLFCSSEFSGYEFLYGCTVKGATVSQRDLSDQTTVTGRTNDRTLLEKRSEYEVRENDSIPTVVCESTVFLC